MTKRANGKRDGIGIDVLKDLPDPPDEFVPEIMADPAGPCPRGLAEVKLDDADTSGFDKAVRALTPLEWALHLVGGSVHAWRSRPDMGALVEAASAWAGPDNLTRRARMDEAARVYEDRAARIEPYRRARLPFPPEWEVALFDAEKAVTATRAAFAEGRERLDKLSELLREATAKAHAALAGSLGNVADRLGEAARKIVNANDPAFLASFPHRAPAELLAPYARAVRVSAVMDELGAGLDGGLARFWSACGEEAEEIVRGKITEGGRVLDGSIERGMRPSEPSPDPLMRATF